ncbi:hypothetical protein PPOP_3082, partial [Paenibacillus popilliae ATCC 14706]
MQALVGDGVKPVTHLAIEILQSGEGTYAWPEVLSN